MAVGQGDDHRVGLRALGLRQGEPPAALGLLELLEADGRELRAPQRAGEADQDQGAVAPAAQIVGDGGQDWRRTAAVAAIFFRGA